MLEMLYNVVPVLFIFISVAIVVILVGRRLTDIASIDLDDIPEVRSAIKKRQLLIGRLDRRLRSSVKIIWGSTFNVRGQLRDRLRRFYKQLTKLEAYYSRTGVEKKRETKSVDIMSLLNTADEKRAEGRMEEAEKKYLAIIRTDHKNIEAYKGLGAIYQERHQYEEARESLEYALGLNGSDSTIYASLAELAIEEDKFDYARGAYKKAIDLDPDNVSYRIGLGDILLKMEDTASAVAAFEEAVAIQPDHPRCLDRLIEVCILVGNKRLAQSTLKHLVEVNPENKKIKDLKKRIGLIPAQRKE